MEHCILIKVYLLLIVVSLAFTEGPQPEVVYRRDGDVVLGGLFALHYTTTNANACRFLRELQALKRVEAMVYAIDRVNANDTILPGIDIGFEIYDTCFYDIVALGRTMNFVPDRSDSICSCHNRGNNSTAKMSLAQLESCSDADTTSIGGSGGIGEWCSGMPLVGLVGAERSESSVQAATLMGLQQTPLVSYLSTSDTLSDRNTYPFFLRTVPPDRYQISVIIDLLVHFGWSYVSFLYSDDEYGQNAYAEFVTQSQQAGICIAYQTALDETADLAVFDDIYANLLMYPYHKARAVVLFAQPQSALKMLTASTNSTAAHQAQAHFTWVGSDGVAGVGAEVYGALGLKMSLAGLLTTVPFSESLADFDDEFESLNPNTSSNPWTAEYFSRYLDCAATYNVSVNDCLQVEIANNRLLSHDTLVMDAVFAYAHAMNALMSAECSKDVMSPEETKSCVIARSMNGTHLVPYLRNVTFDSPANGHFSFNRNGDGEGKYAIENYRLEADGTLKATRVGFWSDEERLWLDEGSIRFYTDSDWNTTTPPASICSEECGAREAKLRIPDTVVCCWECNECEPNEVVLNETACSACPEDALPDAADNYATCLRVDPIPLIFYSWLGPFLTGLCGLGLVSATSVLVAYLAFIRDPLIQGSDVVLHLLILFGITLSFVVGILVVLPQSETLCNFVRFSGSVTYTIIYVPLAFKCVRLYRILKRAKETKGMEEAVLWAVPAQLTIFSLALSLQVVMETVWLVLYPSRLIPFPYEAGGQNLIQITCEIQWAEPLSSVVYNVPFLIVCCVFSILARHLPDNYHEARLIAFSAFGSCILIGAFSVPYIAVDLPFESYLYVSILTCVNSILVLVCVFVIKLYAVARARLREAATSAPNSSSMTGSARTRNTFGDYGNAKRRHTCTLGDLDGQRPRTSRTRTRTATTNSSRSSESTTNLVRPRKTTNSSSERAVTFSDIMRKDGPALMNDQTQNTKL